MTWQNLYQNRFYRSRAGWIDGTTEFWALFRQSFPAHGRVLEIGAGPANPTSRFLAENYELHGVDVDPDVGLNKDLRTATVFDGRKLPFEANSFDGCVSNYVLEHVEDPDQHLAEVCRVLRPGGTYIFRTPNVFHYVSAVARLTPHWVHEAFANRLRNMEPGAHDPYPTHYKLNSRHMILHGARSAGLEVAVIRLIEKDPSYGMSSRLLFLAFMAYERAVNSTERLAWLRANIFAVLKKPMVSPRT